MKFKRFLQGKTKLGQVVYGVVDSLPVPNLLNPIRAVLESKPDITTKELTRMTWAKIDKVRLAVAVLVSYLILSGKATPETAQQLADIILSIL